MSRWDIKPDGVRGVVATTAEIAGKLVGQANAYIEHIDSAAGHAGRLAGPCDASEGLVGMALKAYANHATPELTHIAVRTRTRPSRACRPTTPPRKRTSSSARPSLCANGRPTSPTN
ncbi:DUF6507 family protein [Streptomyces sp. NPDC037389]|uniref:DUF6507 family protein n=1 Tax=Streptomyces sp. NPDC037389 TaxID=3155369 RepID=UPI0033CD8E2C